MSVCYNIPVSLLDSFRDEIVILRSCKASELLEAAQKIAPDNLCYLQLLSPQEDSSAFLKLKNPTLIDLVLDDPREFSHLYKNVELFRRHPVRVTITAAPGFTKGVRLAMSLGLPIKLEVTQPERPVVDELLGLLDHYLHHTTVSQPVEFFHSLFMGFYLDKPVTLWEIQEEDPSMFRYVADAGDILISRRLSTRLDTVIEDNYLTGLKNRLLEHGECNVCPFFSNCAGYFKLPDAGYQCSEITELMSVIKSAASELRKDYESCMQAEGRSRT